MQNTKLILDLIGTAVGLIEESQTEAPQSAQIDQRYQQMQLRRLQQYASSIRPGTTNATSHVHPSCVIGGAVPTSAPTSYPKFERVSDEVVEESRRQFCEKQLAGDSLIHQQVRQLQKTVGEMKKVIEILVKDYNLRKAGETIGEFPQPHGDLENDITDDIKTEDSTPAPVDTEANYVSSVPLNKWPQPQYIPGVRTSIVGIRKSNSMSTSELPDGLKVLSKFSILGDWSTGGEVIYDHLGVIETGFYHSVVKQHNIFVVRFTATTWGIIGYNSRTYHITSTTMLVRNNDTTYTQEVQGSYNEMIKLITARFPK